MLKVRPQPVAVRSPGRRQRRSEETRTRLMRSALRLLQQRSFSQITVAEITEAADVGKGTFFNYFPSKEHVMLAMIAEVGELFEKRHLEFAGTRDVRKTMIEFVHFITSHPPRTPLLMRNLLSSAMSNDLITRSFCKTLKMGERAVTVLFKHGQEIGQVRKDIPAAHLARSLQQLALGTQAVWGLHAKGSLRDRLDDALLVFWNGVATPAAIGSKQRMERKS